MCPLRPQCAVPRPRVADGAGARIAAEEDDLTPDSVVGQDVSIPRARARVLRLRPLRPVPEPGIAPKRVRRGKTAEENAVRRLRIERDLQITSAHPGRCPRPASSPRRPTPRCRPSESRPRAAPPKRTIRDRFASYASARPDGATRPSVLDLHPVRRRPTSRCRGRRTRKRRASEEHNTAASTVVRRPQPQPAAWARHPASASREPAARVRIIDPCHRQRESPHRVNRPMGRPGREASFRQHVSFPVPAPPCPKGFQPPTRP